MGEFTEELNVSVSQFLTQILKVNIQAVQLVLQSRLNQLRRQLLSG